MKLTKIISRLGLTTVRMAVVIMATGLVFAATAIAQEKGASKLMKPINSYADVASLKDGDMVAMACPKCKTFTITYITTEKGHVKTAAPGQEHLCPGCEQKFVVVGQGKAKHDTIIHVCKKCGSKDAFCCSQKQEPGTTKGMVSN